MQRVRTVNIPCSPTVVKSLDGFSYVFDLRYRVDHWYAGKMSKGKILKWKNIEKEKCRKEKYRRGKISKIKNVNCHKLEVRMHLTLTLKLSCSMN